MPSQVTQVHAANEIEYRYVRGHGWVAGYWPNEERRFRIHIRDEPEDEQLQQLSRQISDSVFRTLTMPPVTMRVTLPGYINQVTITGTVEI